MKVAVYGAGAIGGYVAWALARSGADVTAIARGAHLEAIRRAGLRLCHDGKPAEAVRLPATDDPTTLPPQDLVVVSIKHSGLAAAAEGLSALMGRSTVVVFANNGIPWWMAPGLDSLDPGGRLGRTVPVEARVGCVVRASASVPEPGVVEVDDPAKSTLVLGSPQDAGTRGISVAADVLRRSDIRVEVHPDLRPMVWGKLMLNVGLSVPAAVLGVTIGAVVGDPELRVDVEALFDEIRAIARSEGVEPAFGRDVLGHPRIAGSKHRPSLLQDLDRGRPAEIDCLVTAPLAMARERGVATPVLDRFARLIRGKARILGSYPSTGAAA